MKKEKAMEWVKALRSGKYRQGKGRLKLLDPKGKASYCCLGVLGEISGVEAEELEVHTQLATHEVREKAGIVGSCGECVDGTRIDLKVGNEIKSFESLADANDFGATFEEIANWIEKNHELL
jgi:hypothetical protein